MIGQDQFKRIAIRSRELSEREIKAARAGITERSFHMSPTRRSSRAAINSTTEPVWSRAWCE
jgi:hypothetical protein